MSTRSNVDIIDPSGQKAKFQVNSDGYPSAIAPRLVEFIQQSISKNRFFKDKPEAYGFYEPTPDQLGGIIEAAWLTIGHVANFSYFYEVNFKTETMIIWKSAMRWQNAPKNWEEKGYVCYVGENGKCGYHNWVKGKRLVEIDFRSMFDVDSEGNSKLVEGVEEKLIKCAN